MYIVDNYSLAVLFCIITMICWGSWGNTQKLAAQTWRYEYFYWDYVIGVLLCSLIFAFTLGSIGDQGRSFLVDLRQAHSPQLISAFLGGVIFNAANILLSSAIAVCGMAVAFPVGIGIALILGVFINYIALSQGNLVLLSIGVLFITIAIFCNALAYKKAKPDKYNLSKKGLLLSIFAGLIMSFFYRFVAASMDLTNFENPRIGSLTPYTAVFIFSIGVFLSNFLFNAIVRRYPVVGLPIGIRDYFKGNLKIHLVGILGGVIWCIGQSFSMIASGEAGPAISYGLGQGATLVSAFWGIVIWKEFKDAAPISKKLNWCMFLFFLLGLALLTIAGSMS